MKWAKRREKNSHFHSKTKKRKRFLKTQP